MKKFLKLTMVIMGVLALTFACSQQSSTDTPEDTEFINLKVTGMT